jgi:threonine dehydrogenase-like Zn-dependent dehydrogenase
MRLSVRPKSSPLTYARQRQLIPVTAMAIARPGSTVGAIGAPHGVDFPVMDTVVFRNIGLRGGINPGRVFDFETNLDGIAEAYAAMDERRAIKSLIRIAAT